MTARKRILLAVFLVPAFLLFTGSGCGRDSGDRAVSRAATQMNVYGKSRSVVYASSPALEFSDAELAKFPDQAAANKLRRAQQDIRKVTTEQQRRFKKAVDDLKAIADVPAENNLEANTSAKVKTMLAGMIVYQANWGLDELALFDAKSIDLYEKVRMLCIQMEHLKSQQSLIQPETYTPSIDQTVQRIGDLNKQKDLTASQLKTLQATLDTLNKQLADAQKRRDELGVKIGQLTDRLNTVSPYKGVDLQKEIEKLETQRFAILIEIERLTAGPMDLPKTPAVLVGDRTLTTISGIKQLDQEKAFLETRRKYQDEAISSQDVYLKGLRQQKDLAVQKSKMAAAELDKLKGRLVEELARMDQAVTRRDELAGRVQSLAKSASSYTQSATSDLSRFTQAVSQAKSRQSPGVESDYLKSAENLKNLELTLGDIGLTASLDRAKNITGSIKFVQEVVPLLTRAQALAPLPVKAAELLKAAPAFEKQQKADLPQALNSSLVAFESLYKRAPRDLQVVMGTSLALALVKAADLSSEPSYMGKVKEILGKILPEKPTPSDLQDPALQPAWKIKEFYNL